MQGQGEEPPLRGGVHRQVEHRRGLNHAVDDSLDLAGRFLEHQEIIGAEKDNPDRLGDAAVEHGGDLEAFIQHPYGFRIGGGMANGQQAEAGRRQQVLCGIPHLS